MIKVVNKYKHIITENDIYIGRGSVLGNPYSHLELKDTKAQIKCKTREEAVDCYRERLMQTLYDFTSESETFVSKEFRKNYVKELQKIKNLSEKQDVNLVCFCAPKSCHGDIIKEIIELFIKEKKDFI